ncbi:MAG: undecaprenyl-diphosphate phosphatase [Candidatus Bathyarchaeota archaeon]|nr:undecaprenyl-diphosphate phosphatase [Candidatus Bathyarchaeota archaeon]
MLDQLLQTVLLGLIQGISEWLPISSTAHLKLAGIYLGLDVTPLFNIILHAGTLMVVVFFFRHEVKALLSALFRLDFKSENGQLIPRIAVATIPTAVIALLYDGFLESTARTIPIIACTFLIGATVVYSTKFSKEINPGLPYSIVLLMGAAQGFAIFPGLSRSGITISTALLFGLRREKAFKFSFLLSIPAIAGDLIYEFYSSRGQFAVGGLGTVEVLAGVVAAMVVGYFALKLLAKLVRGKKFHLFAFYTWALGIALLIITFLTA